MLVPSLVCSQNRHLTKKQTSWLISLNKQAAESYLWETLCIFPSYSETREGRGSLRRSFSFLPLTLLLSRTSRSSVRLAKWQSGNLACSHYRMSVGNCCPRDLLQYKVQSGQRCEERVNAEPRPVRGSVQILSKSTFRDEKAMQTS